MPTDAREIIVEQFQAVAKELFSYHARSEVTIKPIDAEVASKKLFEESDENLEMYSSSIGLEGDDLSCTIALLSYADTIQSLCIADITSARDWIGELSNLLMGALKNNLSEYNVQSRLGLPVSVRGLKLDFITRKDTDKTAVAITTEVGSTIAVLHFEIPRGVQWEYDPSLKAADDVCLF